MKNNSRTFKTGEIQIRPEIDIPNDNEISVRLCIIQQI